MTETGLTRVDGVLVLSGPALKTDLECVLIAIRQRKLSGLPYQAYEALACELHAAMTAAGHADIRLPAVSDSVVVNQKPTVPINEVAARLDCSPRQARRRAPQLGGQIIGGRWFVDELALREHQAGAQ